MEPIVTVNHFLRICLHFFGYWPDVPYADFRKLFWIAMTIAFQVSQYSYIIEHFKLKYLSHLVDSLSSTLSYSVVLFKLISFWINQGVFRDVLETMTNICEKHAIIDTNNLMSRTLCISHRLSNMVIALYMACVIPYAIGVFLSADRSLEDDIQSRVLILKMKLPFDTNASPVYELVCVTQILHQMAIATMASVVTAVLLITTLQVGGWVDVLCQSLTEISPEDTNRLGDIIRQHQEIISFIGNIEKLYANIALMQFVMNTLIVCCIGFLMVVSLGTDKIAANLVKCVLFYVVMTTESFLFCFAGEYLSAKTRGIGNAAYKSNWYNLRHEECRILHLLILRSQNEITITIGKFSKLSLQSFATIMKASASYISVLLAT